MSFTAGSNWITNIINLLSDSWTRANTANTKPVIKHVTDPSLSQRMDLTLSDYVLLYHVSTTKEPNDLGWNRAKQATTLSIDIRTIHGYTRLDLLETEALRILNLNRSMPTDTAGTSLGFNYIKPFRRMDLTNKQYKLWRYVWDAELVNYRVSITGT